MSNVEVKECRSLNTNVEFGTPTSTFDIRQPTFTIENNMKFDMKYIFPDNGA